MTAGTLARARCYVGPRNSRSIAIHVAFVERLTHLRLEPLGFCHVESEPEACVFANTSFAHQNQLKAAGESGNQGGKPKWQETNRGGMPGKPGMSNSFPKTLNDGIFKMTTFIA